MNDVAEEQRRVLSTGDVYKDGLSKLEVGLKHNLQELKFSFDNTDSDFFFCNSSSSGSYFGCDFSCDIISGFE